MFSRLLAVIAASAALGLSGAAQAAISTFPASVFQAGGNGSNNLVGNTTATARLNRGQTVGLNYASPIGAIAGARLTFNFTQVSNNTTYLWVRLGNWNGAAFTNAAAVGQATPGGGATANIYAQVTSPGAITILLDPFLASCQSIGGCNALVFGNSTFSANGTFFRLSTLVAATPEPSTWAMLMLGFCAVAWRMKAAKAAMTRKAVAVS